MDHTSHTTLVPLLLVSFLAFLIPILTAWISKSTKLLIPAVVGEIICGIVIGKSGLNLISSVSNIPWLEFLSLFGFTYLMFLSGLEIDFGIVLSENAANKMSLEKRKLIKQPIIQAILYFLITLVLATTIALILYNQGFINSWMMMTLILSTTSVSVVVPVIKEKRLSKTLLGQTILVSALLADFLTMILITLVVALHTKSVGTESLLILFVISLFIFLVYKLHISKTFDGLIHKLYFFKPIIDDLSHATTQIKVRGAIALMVLLIVASQLLGFEVILGAFLAGIIVTLILGESKTSQLEMKLDAIGYGFFIPMFFISVGIDIDLCLFCVSRSAWYILILLIISAFAIKILPSFIYMFNFKMKDALSAGVLLSSRLSLIIAASTIGLKQGLISVEVNSSVVLVAVITCIISPILFNKLCDNKKDQTKDKITVIGAGVLALKLADDLKKLEKDFLITAFTDKDYTNAKKRGLPVVMPGDNMQETLVKAGVSTSRVIIATTDQDDYNLSVCITARSTFGIKHLISVVNEPDNIDLFKEQGIDTINKVNTAVEVLKNMIFSPDGYAMFAGQEAEVNVADVWLTNADFDNVAIRTLKLPGDTLIVYIKRNKEAIVPHGDTVLKYNDHITLAGDPKSVAETIALLGILPR
ncbi:MAG: monovalent cation:proton antiporter family protein [Vampirovibrionia bacterium]